MKFSLETLKNIGKKSTVLAIAFGANLIACSAADNPFAAFDRPMAFIPTDSDVMDEYNALVGSGSSLEESINEYADLEEELEKTEALYKVELNRINEEQKKKSNESALLKNQSYENVSNFFIDKTYNFCNTIYSFFSYLFNR